MTTNTAAFFLFPAIGGKEGGTGFSPGVASGMYPEGAPSILWGQGTPDGDRSPFLNVNKGSLYMEANSTDDYSHIWHKVDEGNDDADWVEVMVSPQTLAETYVATELHAWELNYTATAISGANMVGLNIAVTTAGTGASWISGLFVKITEPATKTVNGYFCAAEFELATSCATSSAMAVITLNSNITAMGSDNNTAFIKCQDWGTEEMPALFDITSLDEGSSSNTTLWTTTGAGYEENVDYAIRIVRSAVPYWITACSTGPAG